MLQPYDLGHKQKDRFLRNAKTILNEEEMEKLQYFLKNYISDEAKILDAEGDHMLEIFKMDAPPLLPVKKVLTSQGYNEILDFIKKPENFNEHTMRLFNELNQYIATWMQNYVHSALGTDIFTNHGKIGYNRASGTAFNADWLRDVLKKYKNMDSEGWEGSPLGIDEQNRFVKYPFEYFNSNQVNRQVSHLDEAEALATDIQKPLGENFQQAIMDYLNKSSRAGKVTEVQGEAIGIGSYSKPEPGPRTHELLDDLFSRGHGLFSKEDIHTIMQKLTPQLEEPDIEKVIALMKSDLQLNKEMFAALREHNAGRFNVKLNPATGVVDKTTLNDLLDYRKLRGQYDNQIEEALSNDFHNISANFEAPLRRWLKLGGKDIMALSREIPNVGNDLILDKNNKIVVGKNKAQNAHDATRNWDGNVSRTIVEMQLDPFKSDIMKWSKIVRDAQRKVLDLTLQPEVKDKFFNNLIASGWARPSSATRDTPALHKSFLKSEKYGVTLIDSTISQNLTHEQLKFALASAKFLDGQTPTVDLGKLTASELYYASLAGNSKKQMQSQVLAILQKAEEDGVAEVLLPDGGTAAHIQGWRSNISSAEKAQLFKKEMQNAPEPAKHLFNSISKEYVPSISSKTSGEIKQNYTTGLNTLLPVDKHSSVDDTTLGQLLRRHIYYIEGGKHSTIDATGRSTYAPFNKSHQDASIEHLISSSLLHSEFHKAVRLFTDTLQHPLSDDLKVADIRGLQKPLYSSELHLADVYSQFSARTDADFPNSKTVLDNIKKYGWNQNQLSKINDTYMQPVLLDLAYLISKGFISKSSTSLNQLDFDLIQKTPLPSNYFNTKTNFMASTKASPEAEIKFFHGMQEHLESPVMISTILQLYDKEIAEKLLLTIFEKKLASSKTYNLFGKSKVDTNKLYSILDEELEGPFTNAKILHNIGKLHTEDAFIGTKDSVQAGLRKSLGTLNKEVRVNVDGEVYKGENLQEFLKPPENMSLEFLQFKAAFIDDVAAWAKVLMNKEVSPEEFNKVFSSTKKYGKVASTYGQNLPKALNEMKIPFSIGPASRFAPTRFSNKAGNKTRFYRIDVKKAKEAIEKAAPTIFGLGGTALTGLIAEEMYNETGDATTGPWF
jgi:hypothetical protein